MVKNGSKRIEIREEGWRERERARPPPGPLGEAHGRRRAGVASGRNRVEIRSIYIYYGRTQVLGAMAGGVGCGVFWSMPTPAQRFDLFWKSLRLRAPGHAKVTSGSKSEKPFS